MLEGDRRDRQNPEPAPVNPPESPLTLNVNTGEVGVSIPGTGFTIDPSDGSLGVKIGGIGIDLDGK